MSAIGEVLQRHVDAGALPGAVALVRRGGDVRVDVVGSMAFDGPPMRRDTIFRMASLTKPLTSVAAMMLVEECAIRLDEPVARLLPELAQPRVVRTLDGPVDDTVAARRPITFRDLFTYRLGTGLDIDAMSTPVVQAVMATAPPAARHRIDDADAWLQALAGVPLLAQPGERWLYNTGSDLLAIAVTRASGQPFATFLRERVLEPLGMRDTAFSVPAGKLDRLASGYLADHATGELGPPDDNAKETVEPAHPSASGGILSTVDDYFAFTEAFRDGRLLARTTVAAMTTDQLPPEVKAVSGFTPGWFDSRGWGLGLGVVTHRSSPSASPGTYGWDGGSGTSWWTDPTEDMTAILLTQRGQFPAASPVYQDFWTTVYRAAT
jgi:CubicO group peptidase (beta-lactamase class C family)